MLRIGLSGGIGAGKSTVSATFAECGGIVVDGDVIAREVVEPGTVGLARLVEAFGEEILLPDGALNRPALAAIAFPDDEKRATLNGIVHPLVAERRAELIASAPPDAVIVEDIPLLVESKMAPLFPLVVIVHADEEVRVQRLISYRGFSEQDARTRIAAQATVEERRAVADVWLENTGSQDDLVQRAKQLWFNRILPFARNLQAGEPVAAPLQPVPFDHTWADQAARIVARLQTACGHRVVRVDHVGPTAVPGMDAPDVIDVQVTVESLEIADELADALRAVGYLPLADGVDAVESDARSTVAEFDHTEDAALWRSRLHASADPGRPTNVHLRVAGWPNQQYALLFTDWLRANPGADISDAYRRAWEWADATGWRP
ncbi:dephospho-CoA kinase [Mycolicibacterium smegmatis]|uniref:Dephospho-CoA kinase n=2 Tax=Mycolicibacterium smegmatis (strain ATCC 700084 / mc(2)155) TaxID=246196 RepID=A4ZHS9_MYCS2|nr:dephospho-CoA kinase [Mycolicibacterium smegmatis]ABJ96319.1 putative dephospho-CoA kinase [Mycolicibacterium smegmatis MC2 155]AFP40200.1 Dephospho-CoA kinase [Mycolicibacterium smegmatis MC2 155]AIU08950.1 dephospho-CoA kinase [Mycolicibacterium smegmatis MC2 155]AIU15575.1 dephospho-CoA kinase [Mycolicibacterium smegmatis]AIU22198.1 dephospho-CoA kinase [Mycolicibacterium smegmatis]